VSQTTPDTAALGEELRSIVDHAEALLAALGDEGDAKVGSLRERVAHSIDTARVRLDEMQSDADRASERAAAAFEQWIMDNPWTTVAIGAGVGLAIGILLASRRRRGAADSADTEGTASE
jgi:ElaB/YqjD/DUF883 family membrane-anchored ribosome-binding protein